MKALSIKQPWAWLIVNGYKDIENRQWYTNYRGRIYIHAPKQVDDTGWSFIKERIDSATFNFLYYDCPLVRGCLIGEAEITECVSGCDSPWFVGKYGFVLANPKEFVNNIPWKGQLGLFEVDLS